MTAPVDDQTLLAAAREGDRAALESLLERWQPRIFRFGLKMCGDPDDASEVLQETLLAAARGLRGFRGASSATTWLYSIARRFCSRARRSSRRDDAREGALDSPVARAVADPARGPEESAAAREIARALSAGIGALDPSQREVLILRDVEGLSASQVAEITGVSIEAVKSRLHRARVALRASLAPLLRDQGAHRPPAPEPAAPVREPTSDEPTMAPPPGSPCPDIPLLFSRNLEGEVPADLCAELERHVSGCRKCRSECDALEATLALCRRSREIPLPETLRESAGRAVRSVVRA